MKRILTCIIAVCAVAVAIAQTLNVKTGSITYAFASSQTGEMTYTDNGQTLTICGKSFAVTDISSMTVGQATVADNTVSVAYSGSTASVVIAGNIARHMTATVSGADVTLVQGADVTDEITYTLSGSSTNGSFNMDGELKATVVLNGLTLTSNTGAPINIANGKRIDIIVNDGTVNTFADYAQGTQKACFFVNGHPEFSGGGTVNITGNARHGFRSDEYTKLKKTFTGKINIVKAASDGMHIGQYLEMNSGTVNISNVAADGIDIEATLNATDEQNGQALFNGGTISVTTTGEDVKAVKADADMVVTGGSMKLVNTGNGSKAISTKGALTISGGKVEAIATGGVYAEGTVNESKANAIKATGKLTISGGEAYAIGTNKAFNTDTGFYINGGKVMGIGSKASATNAGTQQAQTYTKKSIGKGATVTYNGVSYTVPSTYSNSSACIIVSGGN